MMRSILRVFSVLAICVCCVAMSTPAEANSVATHAAPVGMLAGSLADVASLSLVPDASVVLFLALPWIFARFTRTTPGVFSR